MALGRGTVAAQFGQGLGVTRDEITGLLSLPIVPSFDGAFYCPKLSGKLRARELGDASPSQPPRAQRKAKTGN